MKTNFTKPLKTAICLALLACLSGPMAFAQNTVTFSKPGYTMQYIHDGTNWVHVQNLTSTYNSAGSPTEALVTHAQTGQNKARTTYTYDANGNQRSQDNYQWQHMNWVLTSASKDSITYNPGNKIVRQVTAALVTNAWQNDRLEENTYDINNRLIESTVSFWSNGAWNPNMRNTTTYDANGVITQLQTADFVNNAWQVSRTASYSAWHTTNKIPAAYTTQTLSPYPLRNTVTLGPNGSYTDTKEYFYTPGNTWRYVSRTTNTFDAQGNLIDLKGEYFEDSTASWQLNHEFQYAYTYNNLFDITEGIMRQTDHRTSSNAPPAAPPRDRTKFINSNFQYFTKGLGLKENLKKDFTVSIFPNPAQDILNIRMVDNAAIPTKVTVTDLAGKTLQNQTFAPEARKEIRIENLKAGIYLLQLETAKGKTVHKFVKQ